MFLLSFKLLIVLFCLKINACRTRSYRNWKEVCFTSHISSRCERWICIQSYFQNRLNRSETRGWHKSRKIEQTIADLRSENKEVNLAEYKTYCIEQGACQLDARYEGDGLVVIHAKVMILFSVWRSFLIRCMSFNFFDPILWWFKMDEWLDDHKSIFLNVHRVWLLSKCFIERLGFIFTFLTQWWRWGSLQTIFLFFNSNWKSFFSAASSM